MKKKVVGVSLMVFALSVTACGNTESATKTEAEMATVEANTAVSVQMEISVDVSDMFTERDRETEYENAVSITLAEAETSATDYDGVTVEGSTVTISDEGTYVLSGSLSDGMLIIDAEDTDKIQLVLNGVTIHSETSAAIYVKQADKVFVTLAEDSENQLSNGGTFTAIDDNNIDAVIFSKDDLTLNGSGSLQINSPAGHGIVSKDDLVVTGGTYQITAEGHGLSGKDSVRIADGTLSITVAEDGIHSDNTDEENLGFVYVEGGDITISAGDDGVHASSLLYVADGNITIDESYEGFEGKQIAIGGGDIFVNASDDGVNAADGSSDSEDAAGGFGGMEAVDTADENVWIWITGGNLNVNAQGDGIDSNGNLKIEGGTVVISGPSDDGNGTLDYNGTAVITGGTVMGSGSSGMAQSFGTDSTQESMMVLVDSQEAGSSICLRDAEGTEILSWTAVKAYQCVIISSPEIVEGATYTLTAGTYETEITMDSITYSEGGMGTGGPMGGGSRNGGPMGGGAGGPMGREMGNPMGGESDAPAAGENGNPTGGESDAPVDEGVNLTDESPTI